MKAWLVVSHALAEKRRDEMMKHNLEEHLVEPYETFVKDEEDLKTGKTIGVVTTSKYKIEEVLGELMLPLRAIAAIEHKNAVERNGVVVYPEHDFLQFAGVQVRLLDGVAPGQDGVLRGQFSIETRAVTSSREGAFENAFLSIRVYPVSSKQAKPTRIRLWNGGLDRNPGYEFEYRYGPDSNGGNIFVL